MQRITDWIRKNAALLLGGLAIFVMMTCFVSGCNYHKNHHPCPQPTTDTIEIQDTSWHQIVDSLFHIIDSLKNKPQPDPVIVYQPGEIIPVPQPVDTAAILARYYTTFRYYWQFPEKFTDQDSIRIKLNTTITENRPTVYDLSYQWLKPQTIINNSVDNSVRYSKYIYAGIDLPLKNIEYASIDILSTFKGGYFGIGYVPLQKGISLKTGIRLFKWE